MSLIQIQWSAASKEEAKKMITTLIEKKLIACANFTEVESIYTWQGKIEVATEVKVWMKTTKDLFDPVVLEIKTNGSYQVSEIGKIEMEFSAEYHNWVETVCSKD